MFKFLNINLENNNVLADGSKTSLIFEFNVMVYLSPAREDKRRGGRYLVYVLSHKGGRVAEKHSASGWLDLRRR